MDYCALQYSEFQKKNQLTRKIWISEYCTKEIRVHGYTCKNRDKPIRVALLWDWTYSSGPYVVYLTVRCVGADRESAKRISDSGKSISYVLHTIVIGISSVILLQYLYAQYIATQPLVSIFVSFGFPSPVRVEENRGLERFGLPHWKNKST